MSRILLAVAALLFVATSAAAAPRPNIVLILTDDLSPRLMRYLPRLHEMMTKDGLEMKMVTSTPLCGPSRGTILTGQYTHNHRMIVNAAAQFHRSGNENETFATWLQRAGYTTGYFGKYLNGYGVDLAYVPPGWDRWIASIKLKTRYEYEVIREDGSRPKVGGIYDVDLYASATRQFISAAKEPFLAVWAPLAPHGPFTGAKRHRGRFRDLDIEWPASFEGDRSKAANLLRARLEMMLAVEEGVAAILETLEIRGVLDNTYIFFTTDNGVFMGEHGLNAGKGQSYEEASRVPLYVRGPGVRVGRSDALVATQDLAPTFAEIAGAPVPDRVDGRSMLPLFSAEPAKPWRERLLLEFWVLFNKADVWQALRTRDVKYTQWGDGRCTRFDLAKDPHEMKPIACGPEDTPYAQAVAALAKCSGHACGILEGGLVGMAAAREAGLDESSASCVAPEAKLVGQPGVSRAPSLMHSS